MTLRTSAPHAKPRWLAVVLTVALAMLFVVSGALAALNFTFDDDDDGPNDEPNQKDLTAQSSAFDSVTGDFYTAWKWDDTAWSGKNTGDACSLFDTDSPTNGLVDYAVCVTVGGSPATQLSTRVYSCGDTRSDRCTNPISLLGSKGAGDTTWCSLDGTAADQFPNDPPAGPDLQATCNISKVDADLASVAGLNNATLVNSCSYPSQEPNSDPSDCVKTITNVNTSVGTLSSGTATWSATLNDTATMSPLTATGSVVFKLWGVNTSGTCSTLIWESASVALVNGVASTVGAGTTSGTNTITNATVDSDGVYYWTVDYTPTGAFNGSSSACGETTTITPASVSGGS